MPLAESAISKSLDVMPCALHIRLGLHNIIFDAANHIVQRGKTAGEQNDDPLLRNAERAGNFQRVGQRHEAGASGGGVEKTSAVPDRLSCGCRQI